MPRVSIVTCTYNRAHLIGETIQSVLEQTFQDFEYIIVDDGSTDRTEDVVNAFADPRLRYYFLPHTGRLTVLRNYSHSMCNGTFIAYVDSDDLWHREKLQKQIDAMELYPAAGFSFTDIDIFNHQGIIRRSLYQKNGVFTGNVFHSMMTNRLVICHTTLVVRRSCFDRIGQSDETFHAGDHDFVFRLSYHFDAVIFYEPLVSVRKHDQNTTNNPRYDLMGYREHHQTLEKLLTSNWISPKEYQETLQITSYSFGSQLLSAGELEWSSVYLLISFRIKPWDLRTLFKLIKVLSKKILRF